MASNQWGDERPWEHIKPNDGGGSWTPGTTIEYNPKTGRYEPTTRPPSIGSGPGAAPGGPGGGPTTTSPATPPPATAEGFGGPATTGGGPATPAPWWSKIGGTGGSNWDTLINAALALYGMNREGQTPNTYPVPLTKTEQETADAKKNLFNYSSAFTDQYLRGFNNLQPDFRLNSNAVGNPEFMGGVKIPQVDWSKMPSAPTMGGGAGAVPGQSGVAENPAIEAARRYGPTAVAIATQLAAAGKSETEIMAVIQSIFGGGGAP